MKTWIFAIGLALAGLGCGSETPTCKKGKLCGDTCIDKDKECHR